MPGEKLRLGTALVESRVRGLMPGLSARELFPSDLLVHITYHKNLTVYSIQVMRFLSREFGFHWEYINNHRDRFLDVARNETGKRMCHITNIYDINYETLPAYRGSHFIRDPRDMVISGYYYHLWTSEEWCVSPDYNWAAILSDPFYRQQVNGDESMDPQHISYQKYLNTLDRRRGMILEMIRNRTHIVHMRDWDINNPKFITMKYEDIIGNEVEAFRRMFEHYGFHSNLIKRGLYYVDKFSLKRKAKGLRSHTRSGTKKQFEKEFDAELRDIFDKMYGSVLVRFGYD